MMNNNKDEVELLLRAKANPDDFLDGSTVLGHAAGKCNAEIVQLLVDAKADPNIHVPQGPALLQAVRGNRPENAQILLRARADIAAQDSVRHLMAG